MIATKENTISRYKLLGELIGKGNLIESYFDFIILANEGINAEVIKNFIYHFKVSKNLTAKILNVSEPTLYRWTKANKSLDRNFSIRLFDVADLFLYGEEVFESRETFFKWLNLPNASMGGLEPIDIIELPGGVSKVKEVLGRIEYGVYS